MFANTMHVTSILYSLKRLKVIFAHMTGNNYCMLIQTKWFIFCSHMYSQICTLN